jgi:hypothetical protein
MLTQTPVRFLKSKPSKRPTPEVAYPEQLYQNDGERIVSRSQPNKVIARPLLSLAGTVKNWRPFDGSDARLRPNNIRTRFKRPRNHQDNGRSENVDAPSSSQEAILMHPLRITARVLMQRIDPSVAVKHRGLCRSW